MALVVFIQEGASVDYSPGADVAAGDVVVQHELVGVAKLDIKAGRLGALAVEGVFDFPAEEPDVWEVGQLAYWGATEKWVTTSSDAGANKLIGKAIQANPRPGNYVRVRLSQ